eukprot:scaffold1033_cov408-Prasinococcus_capsulatus_cf.AAC.39
MPAAPSLFTAARAGRTAFEPSALFLGGSCMRSGCRLHPLRPCRWCGRDRARKVAAPHARTPPPRLARLGALSPALHEMTWGAR